MTLLIHDELPDLPMRLRHQPVIGDDGDETLPRQRASRKAIAATLAAVPAAAVEEDDHRQAIALLGVFGHPDIERLARPAAIGLRSEEHTSELQSLMRISYAGLRLQKTTIT